ncbi:uncharacterized protein LOC120625113 [Pararge aegeria]|nr:uncharacterized protein LOC120625113 [Pararge aegeria]
MHVLPGKINLHDKTYAYNQENDTYAFLSDFDPITSVHIVPDKTNVPDKIYTNQQENNNEAWHQDFNPSSLVERPPNEIKIPTNTYKKNQENGNDVLPTDFDPITLVHILPDEINVPDKSYANNQDSGIGTSAKGLNLINLAKHTPDEITILDNLNKPGENDKNTLITSPKALPQSHNNNLNQNFNLPFWQPNHSTKGTLIDTNGSNMPIDALPGLGGLVKYIPLKSQNPGVFGIMSQSRPTDSKSIEYLSSKYDHPIFNSWLSKQRLSILSNRPFMSNAINFHLLRRLLIKALYENGIHLSSDGDLHDSNGNILTLANLELRPILLSDPLVFEKLIASKKCVIPYNIPYLEAIIVTLVYPPRILAIIPLGLRNDFISSSQGSITPNLCRQPTCHEAIRSGLPEKEELTKELNEKLTNEENNEYLYESKERLGEPTENSNDRKARNNYPYMSADINVPMQVRSTTEVVTFPKDNHTGYSENIKPTSQKRATKHTRHKRSGELVKEIESIYANDAITNHPRDQLKHVGQIIFFGEGKNLENRKSLEDYDVLQEPEQKPEEDDDEMLTIRIVGGNPATSSGTPVSSKGRSGWGP